MTNKEIARQFNLLGKIMELHGENPFKIRSYANAYLTIRKLDQPLVDMAEEDIGQIKGIGKAISGKINELLTKGEMATLERYKAMTPSGIQDLLSIKGFGPKKIKVVWKELGVESAGELLYACRENRLVDLKGFGEKTQTQLIKQLEYFLESKGKYLYANVIFEAEALLEQLKASFKESSFKLVGELVRKLPIVEGIDILVNTEQTAFFKTLGEAELDGLLIENDTITFANNPVNFHFATDTEYGLAQLRLSSPEEFYNNILEKDQPTAPTETECFEILGIPYIVPELRDLDGILDLARSNALPELIESSDIKGVVHNHSTYSDGLQSIREMSEECMHLGYEYFVISDHSKSAFYANGLTEDRLYQQWEEVDALNEQYGNTFKVFKSIESDILNDGSLDYANEILEQFDLVIASVHSNLRMDREKATNRLIKAIENPHTRILGHPTGRLLLSREGYPIDHKKVIDACAANQVDIELNANPYRLDLDWTWIPYAMEKDILISINPDAHSKSGIRDIYFGVCVARKAGLTAKACLNAKNKSDFELWVRSK